MKNAKRELYDYVSDLRQRLGLSPGQHPAGIIALCRRSSNVDVQFHAFKTRGFCGAAFVGNSLNTIILNSNRTGTEQNFDCGHELLHITRHRDLKDGFFNCTEKKQNSFLEWEANEGAAQLIVPYQDFIPLAVDCFNKSPGDSQTQRWLADCYGVTPQVINNRLDSLSYEIDQYLRGVDIAHIEVLSRNQQRQQGIKATPYRSKCAASPVAGISVTV